MSLSTHHQLGECEREDERARGCDDIDGMGGALDAQRRQLASHGAEETADYNMVPSQPASRQTNENVYVGEVGGENCYYELQSVRIIKENGNLKLTSHRR